MPTVRVKIAVAVDATGAWGCCGWQSDKPKDLKEMQGLAAENVDPGERKYWVTADLEIPTVEEVAANVERDGE